MKRQTLYRIGFAMLFLGATAGLIILAIDFVGWVDDADKPIPHTQLLSALGVAVLGVIIMEWKKPR